MVLKYKIELFNGNPRNRKESDKYFWRVKCGGNIVLTSGEGIKSRKTRDRIANNLLAAMKNGVAKLVDLNPPLNGKVARALRR